MTVGIIVVHYCRLIGIEFTGPCHTKPLDFHPLLLLSLLTHQHQFHQCQHPFHMVMLAHPAMDYITQAPGLGTIRLESALIHMLYGIESKQKHEILVRNAKKEVKKLKRLVHAPRVKQIKI